VVVVIVLCMNQIPHQAMMEGIHRQLVWAHVPACLPGSKAFGPK